MAEDDTRIAGRYRLGERIGEGGMADVHLAEDTVLGRKVAVKLLRAEWAGNEEFVARFRQEAQAAAKMTHPTIVKVFDAGRSAAAEGEFEQRPYIVMEYLEGELLRDRLDREGALEPEEAARIVGGVLTALEYSHRAGIIHRDIKPGNIMLTPDGGVKVMDFGIARAASESTGNISHGAAILGTALYFSPEQARGDEVDERTDLYSTGAVLFELLTGRPPFTGDTAVAIAYQHLSEPVPPLRAIRPGIPAVYETVILHALAKQPEHRFDSAAQFRETLEAAASGTAKGPRKSQTDTLTALFYGDSLDGARALQHVAAREVTVPPTQKGPPVAWIWGGIMALLVIVAALGYWIVNLQDVEFNREGVAEVPDVVAFSEAQAISAIEEAGLSPVVLREVSTEVPEGEVIRTLPIGGATMNEGFQVEVYVSSGMQRVTVPNLQGMTLNRAREVLEELGLELGSADKTTSPDIADNRVISSEPGRGESVVTGSTVDLVISNGRVTLPDLRGKSLADAMKDLSSLLLRINPVSDSSCLRGESSPVSSQSPAPGAVAQRSTVTVRYCTGSGG